MPHAVSASETMTAAALYEVAEDARAGVPGCAGATSTIWRDRAVVLRACTHPDLGELIEIDDLHGGPVGTAERSQGDVYVADLLDDTRWPVYAGEALQRGVRCVSTSFAELEGIVITLSLYGLAPGVIPPESADVAREFCAQAVDRLMSTMEKNSAVAEVRQLREAIKAREHIEQAKGMIMQALGCDAGTAFAELVRASQRQHVRIADVAKRLTTERHLDTAE